MNVEALTPITRDLSLEEKVAFLASGAAFSGDFPSVTSHETHMSWVFLAGDKAYKLKKPVRFPYLDFSTLARREAACRAEQELNRRLAPDVYLEVLPLSIAAGGLAVGRRGTPVDWLVVMRRLDQTRMLDQLILTKRLQVRQLERLVETLTKFYRRARPAFITSATHLAGWENSLTYNRRVLLDPRFRLPAGLVRYIDRAQRAFLRWHTSLLVNLVRERRIVDAHGDLRPEHIWLGETVKIIDCLEFNPRLRTLDPFDEVAYLSLECERLGAKWAGEYLKRRMEANLRDGRSELLFAFYRCHRAMLRARLAIAHLLEPNPRTPEKWPHLTRVYLEFAKIDAVRIERLLRTPGDR
jgi:aminoglycoside phosphotransferase family enzyme